MTDKQKLAAINLRITEVFGFKETKKAGELTAIIVLKDIIKILFTPGEKPKVGLLALSEEFGLVRVQQALKSGAFICQILTGEKCRQFTTEYEATLTTIPNTEHIHIVGF